MPIASADVAILADRLRAASNPQGGWGYYPGKASRLEPTCWALLAPENDPAAGADRAAHYNFLTRCQQSSGLLLEDPALPANAAFNGLAALTLIVARPPAPAVVVERLIAALNQARGVKLEPSPVFKQDNTLQGWSWTEGTFSWIEPTAWCLLALKQRRNTGAVDALTSSRIAEAERLVVDRACDGGGWNYGNAGVFNQDLRPYPATTALALLAMQDVRDRPAVAQGWAFLREHGLEEVSGMALALTLVCFRIYGAPTEAVEQRLLKQWERTEYMGNLHTTAMALYALTADRHGAKAFSL